jgi:hypothetical protein
MRSTLPLVASLLIAVSVAGQPLKPLHAVRETSVSPSPTASHFVQSDIAGAETVVNPDGEQPQGVPESASLALLGIGLSGIGALRACKRS